MNKSNKTKIVFPINGVGTIGPAEAKKKKKKKNGIKYKKNFKKN